MPSPETKIKISARKAVKKKYPSAWVYKPQDIAYSGIPDWIICLYGLFIAIELKTPGNGPTPIQMITLQEIRKAGGRTAVCHSVSEVMQFLEEVTRGGS
jgi:hypothetical protein